MFKPTQTGIVNSALSLLGSTSRVTSIDDPHGVAPDAKTQWESIVGGLLSDHPWNWAIKRAALNEADEKPAFGFEHSYALPADCLRVLPPSREDDLDGYERREEGGFILTDAEAPLNVRYISANLGFSVSRWPAYFVRAVEYELAARLAEPVTQSSTMQTNMANMAYDALRKAKRKDGLASNHQTRNRVSHGSDWLDARRNPYGHHRIVR